MDPMFDEWGYHHNGPGPGDFAEQCGDPTLEAKARGWRLNEEMNGFGGNREPGYAVVDSNGARSTMGLGVLTYVGDDMPKGMAQQLMSNYFTPRLDANAPTPESPATADSVD